MSMEVLQIVFHFVITLAIAAAYLITVIKGHPDSTLQNGLLLALGWWFGAIGGKVKATLRKGGGTDGE